MFEKTTMRLLFAAALLASAVSAQADVFNMPSGDTSLQFVTVGNPGNVADTTKMQDGTTGYGSVSYVYEMGKYDVTVAQYCQFLNAVAVTGDPYGLYNSGMATGYPTIHIAQSGGPTSYSYSVTGNYSQGVNCPIFDVSWGDAARFCNWLQNGQPTGAEGNGTTETGSYALNGGTSSIALMAVTRSSTATYVIPTENEWYKAAYYDPTLSGGAGGYWKYPTKSNTAPGNTLPDTGNNANVFDNHYTDSTNYLTPVGDYGRSPGPYGTFDQGGDVYQWNEAVVTSSSRGLRGGQWDNYSSLLGSSTRISYDPTYGSSNHGFRVASVPEPTSLALLLASAVALGIWRQRRKA